MAASESVVVGLVKIAQVVARSSFVASEQELIERTAVKIVSYIAAAVVG
jgi:hypothetical protein